MIPILENHNFNMPPLGKLEERNGRMVIVPIDAEQAQMIEAGLVTFDLAFTKNDDGSFDVAYINACFSKK